jgi:NAD(P)-dependent dehydrogenase (short-subunit alcohol dehydrogenase family)
MQNLCEKVVLITGAGRGNGRDLALSLAAQGAIIAANDISPVNVESVALEIEQRNVGQARVYLHDIAKKVAVQALVNSILADFGRIDLLINSANVEPPAYLLEMDEWDLHRAFEVNAIGSFLTMQSVGRIMREQNGGLMINLLGSTNITESARSAYLASRLALAGITQYSAVELARHNIQVFGLDCGLGRLALLEPIFSSASQAVLALCGSHQIPSGSILQVCSAGGGCV